MRAFYWNETVREAGRETADTTRRHRRPVLLVIAGLLIAALAIRFMVGGSGGADLIVAAGWVVAVAGLFSALFVWKLITIPPRRHAAQVREIGRLRSVLDRIGSDAARPQ